MRLYIEGVGLCGPGLPNWRDGAKPLAGTAPYLSAGVTLKPSELLPIAERRRMTDTVKLALAVGSEATAHAQISPQAARSVFTSSGGDGTTIISILETLATENREVSPTRFHNSVHNAPAGYWSIATQSREASTSICAFDYSFAAGLLEASAQALAHDQPVLLVSYDLPYPGALGAVRPIAGICGIGLVLSPHRSANSLAAISLRMNLGNGHETCLADAGLEQLRLANPSARGFPLLAALAKGVHSQVSIPYVAGNALDVEITPVAGAPA
jgi:hypothetical protein